MVLLAVVVITPHHRLKLGPSNPPRLLRAVLEQVHWISLENLSRRADLDPLLNLLTLPIRPETELPANSPHRWDNGFRTTARIN